MAGPPVNISAPADGKCCAHRTLRLRKVQAAASPSALSETPAIRGSGPVRPAEDFWHSSHLRRRADIGSSWPWRPAAIPGPPPAAGNFRHGAGGTLHAPAHPSRSVQLLRAMRGPAGQKGPFNPWGGDSGPRSNGDPEGAGLSRYLGPRRAARRRRSPDERRPLPVRAFDSKNSTGKLTGVPCTRACTLPWPCAGALSRHLSRLYAPSSAPPCLREFVRQFSRPCAREFPREIHAPLKRASRAVSSPRSSSRQELAGGAPRCAIAAALTRGRAQDPPPAGSPKTAAPKRFG